VTGLWALDAGGNCGAGLEVVSAAPAAVGDQSILSVEVVLAMAVPGSLHSFCIREWHMHMRFAAWLQMVGEGCGSDPGSGALQCCPLDRPKLASVKTHDRI
jgi:hypothetical protein